MTSLGFLTTLLFGVVASMALVVGQLVAAPWIGAGNVLALLLIAIAVGYAALLGHTARRRLGNGAAALAGALLVGVLAHSVSELALGLALVVALVRGLGARRARPLRALLVEIALGAGGLCLARWLAVPGVLGVAAAFWGYALVQSLYYLVPGGGGQRLANEHGDPFERARARLSALLEEL